jgi:hypothetical protein
MELVARRLVCLPTLAVVSDQRVYRVTVRGRFADLTDEVRRYLVRAQPEHDIFVSAFTPEGTFTYDQRIMFFNLRYEVKCATDADPSAIAMGEATQFLRTMGFGHSHLKATPFDVTAVWDA